MSEKDCRNFNDRNSTFIVIDSIYDCVVEEAGKTTCAGHGSKSVYFVNKHVCSNNKRLSYKFVCVTHKKL